MNRSFRSQLNKLVRIAAAVVLAAVFVLMPVDVHAWIDEDASCSITVVYKYEGTGYKLYKVADIDKSGKATLTGRFADYADSIDIASLDGDDELTSEELESYGPLLEGIAESSGAEVIASGKTAGGKDLVFSGLDTGLYLVTREALKVGKTKFFKYSVPVYLPQGSDGCINGGDDDWNYDVRLIFKPDAVDVQSCRYIVCKRWKSDDAKDRPLSIKVSINRDGEPFETVELNNDNNWTYSWEDEEDMHEWSVAEVNVPSGYKVSVESNTTKSSDKNDASKKTTIVLTNTGTIPPPPVNTGDSNNPGVWIGVLAAAGIGLIYLGLKRRNRE